MSVNMKLLTDIPLLRDLTKEERKQIAEITEEITLSKNSFLFRQGDEADSFYIILEGEVEVIKVFSEKEQKLVNMSKGAIIGEMAFLTETRRTGTIRATEQTKLIKISKDKFKKLMQEENIAVYKLVYRISQILSFRLARISEQFVDQFKTDKTAKQENIIEYCRKLFDYL
ncbi:MAG: cyclic nucleotide-binding domain-containing protein [Candidatus Eremiobacterota bacterium]